MSAGHSEHCNHVSALIDSCRVMRFGRGSPWLRPAPSVPSEWQPGRKGHHDDAKLTVSPPEAKEMDCIGWCAITWKRMIENKKGHSVKKRIPSRGDSRQGVFHTTRRIESQYS